MDTFFIYGLLTEGFYTDRNDFYNEIINQIKDNKMIESSIENNELCVGLINLSDLKYEHCHLDDLDVIKHKIIY